MDTFQLEPVRLEEPLYITNTECSSLHKIPDNTDAILVKNGFEIEMKLDNSGALIAKVTALPRLPGIGVDQVIECFTRASTMATVSQCRPQLVVNYLRLKSKRISKRQVKEMRVKEATIGNGAFKVVSRFDLTKLQVLVERLFALEESFKVKEMNGLQIVRLNEVIFGFKFEL